MLLNNDFADHSYVVDRLVCLSTRTAYTITTHDLTCQVLCKPRSFSDTWFAFATDSFNCLLASAQHFSLFVTFTGRSNASKKKSIFLLLPQEFC